MDFHEQEDVIKRSKCVGKGGMIDGAKLNQSKLIRNKRTP